MTSETLTRETTAAQCPIPTVTEEGIAAASAMVNAEEATPYTALTSSIYKQIAERTGGNLYLGVVGPVRSGKSTFIRKFMEKVLVPAIEDEKERARAIDQMPQSSGGRTIMTTEPKFVPEDAVAVSVGESTRLSMRLIDCVGYPVDGALGTEEDGLERLVRTPWSEEEIPFKEAARIGTEKVIREHSTVGILMTTDGSFTGIARECYAEVEERAAKEMKEMRLPFAIVLNVKEPAQESARALALSLEEKYEVPVALVSCLSLDEEDVEGILDLILKEFPLRQITVTLPRFLKLLPKEHRMAREVMEKIRHLASRLHKFADISALEHDDAITHLYSNPTNGVASFAFAFPKERYWECLSELSGMAIESEEDIVRAMMDYARIKGQFERLESAWEEVNASGYGIVMPTPEALELEEPSLVKTANGYGVKLSARAECIHMIKTAIETEISPVVGTEEQSEEVVRYLAGEQLEGDGRVFQCNMFGKSLYDLIKDALVAKLDHLPDEARAKLQSTLEKIINEGANGLICVLL